MKTSTRLIVLLFALFFTAETIAEVTMGIFPRRPAVKTNKFFKPLVKKLSAELGEPVKLVVPKDFKTFWKKLEAGDFDIVHYNQYHYLLSHKKHGFKVFAVNEEFGSNKIAGALTVRKDSGISSVADFKGKTILFGGGKKAMGSFIAPTWILNNAGLKAGADYQVKFAKNPPSAVLGVYNKKADAAGSGNVILKIKGVKSKVDVNQLQIIAESEKFIQLPWAAAKGFPESKVKKIQAVMTGLKGSDDSVLKAAKVTNFVKASDSDFTKVRKIVKDVTGESL